MTLHTNELFDVGFLKIISQIKYRYRLFIIFYKNFGIFPEKLEKNLLVVSWKLFPDPFELCCSTTWHCPCTSTFFLVDPNFCCPSSVGHRSSVWKSRTVHQSMRIRCIDKHKHQQNNAHRMTNSEMYMIHPLTLIHTATDAFTGTN